MKKAIIRTFQAVLTIGILIWLFHSPEKRAQMAGAIAKADRTWLLIGLPVAMIGEVANIVRWQILMRVQGMYMSWRRASMLFFVGLFFNLFMPGYTGGAFARLYYLMREFPDKKKEARDLSREAQEITDIIIAARDNKKGHDPYFRDLYKKHLRDCKIINDNAVALTVSVQQRRP